MLDRPLRSLLILVALAFALPAAAQEPRKVIIDDENFALMHLMLLSDPDVDVIGITTVSGDQLANWAAADMLRGLEIVGRRDVPVSQGAMVPLVNSEAATERWEALYGKLTWKGAWMKHWVEPTRQSEPPYHRPEDPVLLPGGNPTLKPTGEIAANFLIRMVHKFPGQVTIFECGPMTNLALAQRLDPQFASLARELVVMGGSFNPRQMLGNKSAADFAREFENTPRREFNVRFDPEAASIVARSPWRKITIIPVDPSTATQRTPELLERMASVAKPSVAAFIRKLEPGFPLWDDTAAGAWLDPSLVTKRESLYVDYDTVFGPGYGDVVSWHEGYQPGLGEQKADVIQAIDVKGLEALMVRLVGRGAPKPRQ